MLAEPTPEALEAGEQLRRRHLDGIARVSEAPADPRFAAPDEDRLPSGEPLPEVMAAELTPGVLRAGILRDGCLLVRGLIPDAEATGFAQQIDHAYEERERAEAEGREAPGWYEEFEPEEGSGEPVVRPWIKQGGGLLAADSPLLCARMIELFRAAGLPELFAGYLGEPALISVHKTTLRKAQPTVPGAWHQDGYFMGPVRSVNLWLALSRCGDVAPGLDIVPRRLESYVATATDEAALDYTISQRKVQEAAGQAGVVRPVFNPGDALLFDELFLHQTGSDPSMPHPRFAVESWFFGGSRFPAEYAPIAI